MQPYLSTARRYRFLLVTILAVVWGAGLIAAYHEYTTTFQSEAMIWVQRASPELTVTSPDDPNLPVVQTAASQQAELLSQLLATESFVQDVVARASQDLPLPTASDGAQSVDFDRVRANFRVRQLGTALLSVSYSADDPRTAAQMVRAALAVRNERVAQARVASTTAVGAFYRKEYEAAQTQALEIQAKLDEFIASHKEPLSETDKSIQSQLRLTLDFAQVRLADLRGRTDKAILAPALLQISGLEFQVVDEPREEASPRGGARAAATIAVVALAVGSALAVLLIVLSTLLTDHVVEPADVSRLASAPLFATVPRLPKVKGIVEGDARGTLAGIVFGDGQRDREVAER